MRGVVLLLTSPEILPCGWGAPRLYSSEFLHLRLLPAALSWPALELQPLQPEAYSSWKITLFSHLTVHTKKWRPTEGKHLFWSLDHVGGLELPSLQSQTIPTAHHYLQTSQTGPARERPTPQGFHCTITGPCPQSATGFGLSLLWLCITPNLLGSKESKTWGRN